MNYSKRLDFYSIIGVVMLTIVILLPHQSQSAGLDYSTFLSGSNDTTHKYGVAVDTAGNIYMTGYTVKPDFPTTVTGYDTSYNGVSYDVVVCKINPNLSGNSSLVYSTYLGGSNQDAPFAIAVDNPGNVYVTGYTLSSDFPITANAYSSSFDAFTMFLCKLNPTLSGVSSLVYSTFYGGYYVIPRGIAVDNSGNVYVAGYTQSDSLPTTPNAFDTVFNENQMGYICKFNPNLSGDSSLIYSTYFGGNNQDQCHGIAVDNTGKACVTGYTRSSTFPTTTNAYNTVYHDSQDFFVSKLNLSLSGSSALVYSTLLGGDSSNTYDSAEGIAVDYYGNIYITGYSSSTTYPVTPNAYDTTQQSLGFYRAFISKINPSLSGVSSLVYSTYFGDFHKDTYSYAIALDAPGNVYITGETFSPLFPTTSDAYDTSYNGEADAFLIKMKLNLPGTSALIYSTYLGGSNFDIGAGIAVDKAGKVSITGYTVSSTFPSTGNAYDSTFNGVSGVTGNGNWNIFVSQFSIPASVTVLDWMDYTSETREPTYRILSQ